MRTRNLRILRRHPYHPLHVRHRLRIPGRHHDSTPRNPEIKRQQQISLRFEQHIAPDNPEARAFSQPTQLTGKRNVIQTARHLITNARSLAALDSLEDLWTEIESLGFENSFEIDLGDVSSLDYYTGLSLKIFVHGAGTSVGRGGRYDGLTGSFGRAEPAVGFVLNLDALTEVLGRNIAQER